MATAARPGLHENEAAPDLGDKTNLDQKDEREMPLGMVIVGAPFWRD
jgi:hypothetical protein